MTSHTTCICPENAPSLARTSNAKQMATTPWTAQRIRTLTPAWRTTLEKPYLWIDRHPVLFINLFHGLAMHYNERPSLEPATSKNNYYQRGGLANASEDLLNKVENIKMVLCTMVPALFHRMRRVQLSVGSAIAKDSLLAQLHDCQETSPGSSCPH